MAGRQPILSFRFSFSSSACRSRLRLATRVENADKTRGSYWKIIKRALIIFALGLFLAGFPYFNLGTIRIMGVLQRIAICYLVAALIFLKTNLRQQLIITAALLVGYWLVMTFVPAPGFMPGDYSREGCIACFIDRKVLGNHIWSQGKIFDPEGLLSTLPAIATTLLGVISGALLRSPRKQYEKVSLLFIAGLGCIIGGWLWNLFFPINKSLWTSSYVLFTGGLAMQFLALCYWLVDMKEYRRWAKPFVVFGVNAIALFVGGGPDGEADGADQGSARGRYEDRIEDVALRQTVCLVAAALSSIVIFCDRFHLAVAGLDVDSLQAEDFHQDLKKQSKVQCPKKPGPKSNVQSPRSVLD